MPRSRSGILCGDCYVQPGPPAPPVRAIASSPKKSTLPEARRHADDLFVYDNTPNGKGHRLVARFIAGELVKTTHSIPDWLKNVFGRELRRNKTTRKALTRTLVGDSRSQSTFLVLAVRFCATAQESLRSRRRQGANPAVRFHERRHRNDDQGIGARTGPAQDTRQRYRSRPYRNRRQCSCGDL